MKNKINTEELKSVLRTVKPGLGDGQTIEQSDAFAFVKDKVITYNDEICVSHPVTNLQITGAIKADELYKLLEKIDKPEISIYVKEKQLFIRAGRIKAEFQLQTDIKLPLDTIEMVSILDKEVKWRKIPDGFLYALQFAYPVCSTDNSRLTLTCISIRENGSVEASDGFRILKQNISQLPIKDFLLPARIAREIIQFNPKYIYKDNQWGHFKTESGTIISCRIIKGEYPDVGELFLKSGKTVIFPKGIEKMINNARIFTDAKFEYDENVNVDFREGQLKVSSQSESGKFEQTAKVKFQGNISFDITPILFENIFNQTRKCIVAEKTVNNETKGILQFKGENWKYLASLKNTKL